MESYKGYYSIIQFCPEPSRLEAANVGVVLFCPELSFIQAKVASGTERVRKFFGSDGIDLSRLNADKRSVQSRLEVEKGRFKKLEDLERFIRTRANELILTDPRPMRVHNPHAQIEELFAELVGGRAKKQESESPEIVKVERFFKELAEKKRAKLNVRVELPKIGTQLQFPYAYQNGVLNLVKPKIFGADSNSVKSAMILAYEGELLRSPGVNTRPQYELIVIPSFEGSARGGTIERQTLDVLREKDIRIVQMSELDAFTREVSLAAHELIAV